MKKYKSRHANKLQEAIKNNGRVEVTYTCVSHDGHKRLTRIVEPKEIGVLKSGKLCVWAEENGDVKSFLLEQFGRVTAVKE